MDSARHRILMVHAAPGIPLDGTAGGSRHLREVIRAMDRAGHGVTLVSRRPTRRPGDPVPDLPCDLRPWPQGTLPGFLQRLPSVDETVYDRRLGRHLRAVAREVSPTLLYERHSLFSLAGLRVARRLGIPSVLEVNAPLARERITHEGLRAGRFARLRERQALRGADRVICVSRWLEQHARELGVDRERVRVISNGVDVRAFHPRPPPPLPAGMGALEGRFVVGFCGSLKPWHDLALLLDALSMVTDAALLVIGDGPGETTLRARTVELGLEPRVVWAGAQAGDEVPELLALCDALAVPSPPLPEFYFSPLKLLEGLALGLPVVATDIGDAALIAGGDPPGAVLVPAGDAAAFARALEDLAADPDLRRRLGEEGRRRTVGHTWDRVLDLSLDGL